LIVILWKNKTTLIMHTGDRKKFIKKIFSLSSESEFEEAAMELFHAQSQHNRVYKKYLELLGARASGIKGIMDIPCLPVSLFRTHRVIMAGKKSNLVFTSSGTGGDIPSRHHVHDPHLYQASFLNCFEHFYGPPPDYCILALLPSYLERTDSSLVYMAGKLIEKSSHPESGFYLNNTGKLAGTIARLEKEETDAILLGVSFALLDLVEEHSLTVKTTRIMETGGMKGRRKELTREELHQVLSSKTGATEIHSEYGMTEMLSQAYSRGGGRFSSPPWMKVMIRDSYNPFSYLPSGRSGGVNIIDLANMDSCAFLETSDMGRMLPEEEFEILGRFDHSDIRGCNLLAE
jgi:phenylacetate-coenzyme A ligase PaaK-like adenylate-forming protein